MQNLCTPCADAKLDIERGRSLHKPQTTDSVLVLSFISPKSFHLCPFPNASLPLFIAAKQFQIPRNYSGILEFTEIPNNYIRNFEIKQIRKSGNPGNPSKI
jgi:hypothetical protein